MVMAGAGSYHCPTLLVKLPSRDCNAAEPLVPRDGIFCGQDSRCDLTWTNSLCHRLNEPNRRKGKAVLLKYGVLRSVFSGLMLFFTLAKNQWKGLQGVAAKQWPKCPTSSSGHTELQPPVGNGNTIGSGCSSHAGDGRMQGLIDGKRTHFVLQK